MNELPEIYKRIEYLRNKGVKMKEIADHTNMAASVLSSLYSSVLPTYIGCIKKGNNEEESTGLRAVASEQCVEKTPFSVI
mgnify:CR=1 FL=1